MEGDRQRKKTQTPIRRNIEIQRQRETNTEADIQRQKERQPHKQTYKDRQIGSKLSTTRKDNRGSQNRSRPLFKSSQKNMPLFRA